MSAEKINQEFRLEFIDETKNYLIEEVNQNELMSKKQKHKKVYRALDYIKHLLILISTVTGPVYITSSAIGLKICVIPAEIKKYKSTIKKKRKHGKMLSLAKSKINSIKFLISKSLINSNISHEEFVLIKNLPKEFGDVKEEIKNSNSKSLNYIYKNIILLFEL